MAAPLRCDACRAEFPGALTRTLYEDGGISLWTTCPFCGAFYPVAHVTAEGCRLQEQLAAIEAEGNGRGVARRAEKLRQRIGAEVARAIPPAAVDAVARGGIG